MPCDPERLKQIQELTQHLKDLSAQHHIVIITAVQKPLTFRRGYDARQALTNVCTLDYPSLIPITRNHP